MSLLTILALYIAFRVKQFVCDYALQNGWIAKGKGLPVRKGGAWPLAVHAGGHAAGTLVIMLLFMPHFWWLAAVDFIAHGAIDMGKAAVNRRYALTPDKRWYWLLIGLDQEAHNFTHLAYIVMIVVAATPAMA